MTTPFLEKLDEHVQAARPAALELRELKKIRERARQEEIYKVLYKYEALAKEYPELEIVLAKSNKSWLRYTTPRGDLGVAALITAFIAGVCLSPLAFFHPLFLVFEMFPILFAVYLTQDLLTLKENDNLKLTSNKTELVISGNPDAMKVLSAIDIEAAIENWLSEQEEKEIISSEPDDIETVYSKSNS